MGLSPSLRAALLERAPPVSQIFQAPRLALDCEAPPMSESDDDLLVTREVADWLRVSPQWLHNARGTPNGPPFVKYSPRHIKYRRGAVKQWLEDQTRQGSGR